MTTPGGDEPLVSCIMPTHDRRRFVPLALEYFRRQDHPRTELIVIDDGRDSVADLVEPVGNVSYVRLERRWSLGAKRNLACDRAAGEVIVHWDDDDWSAPWRISYQVGELLRRGADICGLRSLLFYDERDGAAWRYSYPDRASRPWVAGGTLCYTKGYWARHPFPEIRVGEDTRFVWSSRSSSVLPLEDDRFYVALIHPASTSRKRTIGERWRPVDGDVVTGLLGTDADHYRPGTSRNEGAGPALVIGERAPDRVDRRPDPIGPRVTASVPYHRCPEHVAEAVESLLAQTHTDLTVVVVNDGDPDPPWDRLAHLDDPRLVRFDLSVNRGRYYADAVVLGATPDRYLLVQDADDLSAPTRLARLLGAMEERRAVAAVSAMRREELAGGADRPARVIRFPAVTGPVGPRFTHVAPIVSLFDVEAARRIGGFYGGFRIGYDTFFMLAMHMLGPVAYVDEPLYTSRERAGSLTRDPSTGHRSATRLHVSRRLRELHRRAHAAHTRYVAGDLERDDLAGALARLAAIHAEPGVLRELQADQARLRRSLDAATATAAGGATPWNGRAVPVTTTSAGSEIREAARAPAATTSHAVPGIREVAASRSAAITGVGSRTRPRSAAPSAGIADITRGTRRSHGPTATSTSPDREGERSETRPPSPTAGRASNGGPGAHPVDTVRSVRSVVQDVYQVLEDPRLPWGSWPISRAVAVELAARLEERRPRRILEAGSGISTVVLALYARRHGAEVIALEHDPGYADTTRGLLASLGLRDAATVLDAPLRPRRCADGRSYPWYERTPQGPFEQLLVDGPPGAVGRQAALFALAPTRATDWELWLDDARRDHERACVELWRAHLAFSSTLVELDGKGQYVLGPADAAPSVGRAANGLDDVGVAILVERGVEELRRTVASLDVVAPGLLQRSAIAASADADVRARIEHDPRIPDFDHLVDRGRGTSGGVARSRLLAELAAHNGVEYVLVLDDSWWAGTLDPSWIHRARGLLADDPAIGQVRLRHASERVLPTHMCTGRPIDWVEHDGHVRSDDAHFTYNPSLIRARDVATLVPARDEAESQRRFRRAGFATAQLRPGVFHHLDRSGART